MCTFILLLIDIWVIYSLNWASLVAQLVKNPPATQESSVQFLGLGRSTGEGIAYQLQYFLASLVVQLGKNSLAKWETCVPFLDWEDTLEMWMATRSSILTWRIPWTIQSMVSQRVRHDWATELNWTDTYIYRHVIGLSWWLSGEESTCNAGDTGDVYFISRSGRFPRGGHGKPLQYSCLKNPINRRAWQG